MRSISSVFTMTDSFKLVITKRGAVRMEQSRPVRLPLGHQHLSTLASLLGSTSAPLIDIAVQVKISGPESSHYSPSSNLIQLHCCHLSGYLTAKIARRVRLRSEFPKVEYETLSHDIEKGCRNKQLNGVSRIQPEDAPAYHAKHGIEHGRDPE